MRVTKHVNKRDFNIEIDLEKEEAGMLLELLEAVVIIASPQPATDDFIIKLISKIRGETR